MHTARLEKLAAFLDTLPEEKFCYSTYVSQEENDCGTVCCAIGWLPHLDPENFSWYKPRQTLEVRGHIKPLRGIEANVAAYFDITLYDTQLLFVNSYLEAVTPSRLTQTIRNYICAYQNSKTPQNG